MVAVEGGRVHLNSWHQWGEGEDLTQTRGCDEEMGQSSLKFMVMGWEGVPFTELYGSGSGKEKTSPQLIVTEKAVGQPSPKLMADMGGGRPAFTQTYGSGGGGRPAFTQTHGSNHHIDMGGWVMGEEGCVWGGGGGGVLVKG